MDFCLVLLKVLETADLKVRLKDYVKVPLTEVEKVLRSVEVMVSN